MKAILAAAYALFSIVLQAKDKPPTVTIVVVNVQTAEKQTTRTVPFKPAASTTHCEGEDLSIDYSVWSRLEQSQDCSTTTTRARPPQKHQLLIEQVYVKAIMPDGRHITLSCEEKSRGCAKLLPTSYKAEVGKTTVWMQVDDSHGMHKLKYQFQDGW